MSSFSIATTADAYRIGSLSNTNFLSDCPIIQKLTVSHWATVTASAELCFCLAILEENLLPCIL